jgi:hypothetical protein
MEYALPLALVVGVAVVFGMSLLPGIEGQLGGSVKREGLSIGDKELVVSTLGKNPAFQTKVITLRDGTQIYIDDYPTNLRMAIETVGVDGTTEQLMTAIRTLARQLKEKGKLNQDQVNRLDALADQGHRLATIQGVVEDAAVAAQGNKEKFANTSVTFDGVTYANPFELSRLISASTGPEHGAVQPTEEQFRILTNGHSDSTNQDAVLLDEVARIYREQTPDFRRPSDTEVYWGKELHQMYIQFQEAQRQGGMAEPAVQQLVQQLVNQVAHLSHITSNAVYGSQNLTDTYRTITPNRFREIQLSGLTHQHSGNICTVGGGQDSGTQCQ